MPYSAPALVSPWLLALPSFELNTSFLNFYNLTLSTTSGFCGCVYKLLGNKGLQLHRKLPKLKSSLQDYMLLESSGRQVPQSKSMLVRHGVMLP